MIIIHQSVLLNSSSKPIIEEKMSPTVFIVFCVLLSTESIFICIGNAFTIFVFSQKRFSLQRTYYLLLNLTVADLLVGVMLLISVATRSVPFLFSEPSCLRANFHYNCLLTSLTILFSSTSVFSLAGISLERVYAVVWPLRHRTLNTRVYTGGIAFIWAVGICVAVLFMLPFSEQVVDSVRSNIAVNITILLSLLVVGTSYMIMRNRLNHTLPIFDSQNRRNMARNIKLSKTMFIVIGLSLICWLPAAVLYTIIYVCSHCILEVETIILTAKALHLANSVVNPIVYNYRMPMFKEALRRLFRA